MTGIGEGELGGRLLNELEAELLARFESPAALSDADAATCSRYAQQLEAAAQLVISRAVRLDAKRLLARAIATRSGKLFAWLCENYEPTLCSDGHFFRCLRDMRPDPNALLFALDAERQPTNAELVVRSVGGEGALVVPLTKSLTRIGRAKDCEVRFVHDTISRYGALIRFCRHGVLVEDQGSGTWVGVGGSAAGVHQLARHDVISIGTCFKLEVREVDRQS